MDCQEVEAFGQPLHLMTHSDWVGSFRELGVFKNVYDQLGLSELERCMVGWKSEPLRYFYRNQFVATHWKFVRIMEEFPSLKVVVLSLSGLISAAELAQEKSLAVGMAEYV